MIKGSIHQENIVISSMCSPYNRLTKYAKQKLIELKDKINKITILVDKHLSFNNLWNN